MQASVVLLFGDGATLGYGRTMPPRACDRRCLYTAMWRTAGKPLVRTNLHTTCSAPVVCNGVPDTCINDNSLKNEGQVRSSDPLKTLNTTAAVCRTEFCILRFFVSHLPDLSEPGHDPVLVSRQEHHRVEASARGGPVRLPPPLVDRALALRVGGGHLLRRPVCPVSNYGDFEI